MLPETLPPIRFLASSLLGKVPLEARWAEAPLPVGLSESVQSGKRPWTYGQYFQAIREALSKDSFEFLLEATRKQLGHPLTLVDVKEILIYAEKHGNLYHPAKIEVVTNRGIARFVINVALTEAGRAAMPGEVRALTYLAGKYPYPWLPVVYFYIEYIEKDRPSNQGGEEESVSLFLADWFEGFHEFHLSHNPEDKTQEITLWDGGPRSHYLSKGQTGQLYTQISKILTLYYDPTTFEQIFPWHHGAGDFVVKAAGEKAEPRLVTARQYGAMTDPAAMSAEESLLFFFLNLSLRMRLDRLDGVGEVVWAEEECLDMTWVGFKEALQVKEKEGALALDFRRNFRKKLKRISEGALIERFLALLESYDPQAPDLPVIKQGLAPHITRIYDLIKGLK